MAIAMVIIAQYHMVVNLFGETICKSEEEPVCPICQTKLKFRDWRRRISIKEGREVTWIMIRRLYCKKCRRLHNELPDILSPYKHYEAETIEGVVDGINKRIEELDKEKNKFASELNIEKAKDAEIIIPEMVSKALSDWSSLSFDSKKLIAQTFIEKVVIYDVDIDIVYR
ncbi:MAG: hypothetical protein IJM51_07260 [Clostridia bacterium]|nr:hypothetical protein [Clostridia bacterium]